MARPLRLWLTATALAFASLPSARAAESAAAVGSPQAQPFAVSLDWTGESLESHNLDAIAALRKDNPGLRFVHFLSPLYFAGPGKDEALRKIKAQIGPQDDVGVYLSAGKAFVQKAGVIFRPQPSFWGRDFKQSVCQDSCGEDVPLTIYPKRDLDKLVGKAVAILTDAGFAKPEAMKVRGWLANADVTAAARGHGIAYDFSAVNPAALKDAIGYFPLYQWLEETWGAPPEPVSVKTVAGRGEKMVVVGTTAPVDFLSTKKIEAAIASALAARPGKGAAPLLHISFTQETAYQNVGKVRAALARIKEASAPGQEPVSVALPELAAWRPKNRS